MTLRSPLSLAATQALSLRAELRRLWSPSAELSQRQLEDHRRRIAACLMVIGPLSLGFWLWDWANDPVGARATFALRLLYLLLIPTGLLALKLRRPRTMGLMLHLTLLWTVTLYSLLLTRMEGGMQFGMAGYLTFYFFALFMLPGLSVAWTPLYALLMPLVPHGLALAGWLPGFPHLAFGLLLWPMSACTVLLNLVTAQNELRRYDLEQRLEAASNTDPLTGVSNRRRFLPALATEMRRALRHGQPMAVLMIDIDHFKRINDVHGHPVGDEAIRCLARLCGEGSRSFDLVARMGGEEFALMLPGTGLMAALATAERIRQRATMARVVGDRGLAVGFTVSVGVAVLMANDDATSLLARADKALYQAKHEGRNRVSGPSAG